MQNFITKTTYEKLIKQLKNINDIEIPRVSKEKLEAARQGDLSENAEYDAAKEKLDFLHHRFHQLQTRVSNPVFIDDLNIPGTVVSIGTIVSVEDTESGEEETFIILGVEDSNADKNIISFQSPIAKGIIGKKPGDKSELTLPYGQKIVKIKSIDVYQAI